MAYGLASDWGWRQDHGFDQSEEAVYRHYCRSRLSSALQAANARQLHHLAADAPAPPTWNGRRYR